MVITGFGHRPDEVGDYSIDTLAKLTCFVSDTLVQLGATKVISGMGLGLEQAMALAALELKLPLIAALPFDGMEKMWPERSQQLHRTILKDAANIHTITPSAFTPFATRDRWAVDNSEGVLILWKNWKSDEKYEETIKPKIITDEVGNIVFTQVRDTNGILQRIVEYADDKDKAIYQLWPQWVTWNGESTFDEFRDMMLAICEG
jgi:uncharacterized phage-like protein YoqJ